MLLITGDYRDMVTIAIWQLSIGTDAIDNFCEVCGGRLLIEIEVSDFSDFIDDFDAIGNL